MTKGKEKNLKSENFIAQDIEKKEEAHQYKNKLTYTIEGIQKEAEMNVDRVILQQGF